MAHIGKSISIRGTVTGHEDLVIDGRVEGQIQLENDELTIGAEGQVVAELRARSVVILGSVQGDVTATERIVLRGSAQVHGDLLAPRLAIEEGARLEGAVRMEPGAPRARSEGRRARTEASPSEAAVALSGP